MGGDNLKSDEQIKTVITDIILELGDRIDSLRYLAKYKKASDLQIQLEHLHQLYYLI